jgi:hypothetical protein
MSKVNGFSTASMLSKSKWTHVNYALLCLSNNRLNRWPSLGLFLRSWTMTSGTLVPWRGWPRCSSWSLTGPRDETRVVMRGDWLCDAVARRSRSRKYLVMVVTSRCMYVIIALYNDQPFWDYNPSLCFIKYTSSTSIYAIETWCGSWAFHFPLSASSATWLHQLKEATQRRNYLRVDSSPPCMSLYTG